MKFDKILQSNLEPTLGYEEDNGTDVYLLKSFETLCTKRFLTSLGNEIGQASCADAVSGKLNTKYTHIIWYSK